MLYKNNKGIKTSQLKKIFWLQTASRDTALHKMADLEVLKQLKERKYEIYIVRTKSKKNQSKILENFQLNQISVPFKRIPLILPLIRTILFIFLLPFCILRLKPDFIIQAPDVSIISLMPIIFFSKLKRVKIILDIRTIPVETSGFRGFMLKFWFVASLIIAKKFFDGITIITSSMKEDLCSRFKINPRKVGVWTSGVSPKLFDPSKYASKKLIFKRKLGLSGKFLIFYHGIFTATRGLIETIEAIKLLKNKYPNTTFFLLGRGPIDSKLKHIVRKEHLQGNVIIHDAVDQTEVPKYISICDVGIIPLPDHPYWRYQSPFKLLEYLAMEKVIVLTDIPAHRSVTDNNDCVLYLSSIKPTEIAKTIEYAYNKKTNLKTWGKIGRKIIEEKYTWEKVADDLENYLLSLE